MGLYYAFYAIEEKGHTMTEKLLSPKQVADALSISHRQVLYLIEHGELEHIRIGKKTIRVKETTLEAYLNANTVNSSQS